MGSSLVRSTWIALALVAGFEVGAAQSVESDVPSNHHWERTLLDTGVLRVRARWPVDRPFAVSMRRPIWLGNDAFLLRPVNPVTPLRPAFVGTFYRNPMCGNVQIATEKRCIYQELGTLPLGKTRLTFRGEFLVARGSKATDWSRWNVDSWLYLQVHGDEERQSMLDPVAPEVEESFDLTFDVEIVPTLDDALPPVTSRELDELVRRSLALTFDPPFEGRCPQWNHAQLLCLPRDERLRDVALSLSIEVLEGDQVRQTLQVQPTADCIPEPALPILLPSLPQRLAIVREARRDWSLRVRGTDVDVLRSFDANRRWSGTLLLSIDELLDRGYAREKR